MPDQEIPVPETPLEEPAVEDSADVTQDEDVSGKAAEYLAALQRERADFLNYKRRSEQENRLVASSAAAMVVDRLLPVLDDLSLATAAVEPSIAALPWTQGVLAVQRKFESALKSLGVNEIEVEGKPFDPRLCEALMEAEGPKDTVVSVLQRGYTIGDQLIRPARVVVGRGDPAATENMEKQTSEG